MCQGIFAQTSVGPRPESFPESDANRIDEGLIWMGSKEGLKTVNIDLTDYGKKVGVLLDGVDSLEVVEF